MKTEVIKMATSAVKSAIAPKAEQAAVVAIEDGAKKLEVAQDAMASQGKAMVKKAYVAPDMKVVKIKQSRLQAASVGTTDPTDGGGNIGGGDAEGEDGWARASSVWDDAW